MQTSSKPVSRPWLHRLFGVGGLAAGLMTTLTACLPTLELPIPEPTGTFPVGITQQFLLESPGRGLTLDIWYPASETKDHPKVPYTEDALNDILSKVYGMPRFLYQEVPSYAHLDAPPVPGRHPVVLFNHGFASFTKQNFSTFQELASHGYVVISLGHPGESLTARDAQGKLVSFDTERETYREIQKIQKAMGAYAAKLAPVLERQRRAQTPEAFAQASVELGQDPQYAALKPQLRRWVQDTRHVITAIQAPRREGILDLIDPDNLTVMGHSLGGAVAMHLATQPPKGLRGIVNLDGPWFQDDPTQLAPIAVPALNLVSTHILMDKQDLALKGTLLGLYRGGKAGAHVIEVKGAAHYNFTDLNFVPALKFTQMLGPVDARLMAATQTGAIMTFLRQTRREGRAAFEAPLLPAHADLIQHVFPGERKES
ncbi:alpha/beta fold hydrolase [bacterium]|nr:alpha/beta fold hydrolase [bacterium]